MQTSAVPPPVWTLIYGAAMWVATHYWPVLVIVPEPWNRLGWCVMAIAPVTPVAAVIQFRRAQTTVNPHTPESTTALVTSGVYAWTRNPMYVGLAVLLLGWAIRLGALSSFLGAVLFVPHIQHAQIRPEEHALRVLFGRNYEQYCRRVNRWLGRSGRS